MAKTVETLITELDARISGFEQKMAQATKTQQRFDATQKTSAAGADTLGRRYGMASIQIAGAAENMARAGAVGGAGLKQIISQGSQMAGLFGPTGAIVGAVGIGLLAVVEIFRRTNTETKALLDEIDARAKKSIAAQLELVRASQKQLQTQRGGLDTNQRFDAKTGLAVENPAIKQAKELERQLKVLFDEETRLLRQVGDEREQAFTDEVARLVKLRDARAISAAQRERLARAEATTLKTIAFLQSAATTGNTDQRRSAEVALVRQLDLLKQIRGEKEKAVKPSTDFVDPLDRANKALDEFREKREKANREIGEGLAKAQSDLSRAAGDAVAVLDQEITELTERFRALGATDAEIVRLVAPLEAARKAALGAAGAVAKITISAKDGKALGLITEDVDEAAEAARRTAKEAAALARSFDDAADLALGIATALGGADDRMTRLIGGAGQLVSAFGKIAGLAKEAGGLGALLSTGGGIASLLPAVGGIIAGIGALASVLGKSPQEAEHERILAANTAALEKLRTTLGDALKISASGDTVAGVTSAFDASGIAGSNGPVEGFKALFRFQAELKRLGVSFEDVRGIARDLGVELSQNPTLGQLQKLGEALKQLDFDAFGAGFKGAMRRLEIEARIDPKAFEGINGLIARIKVLAGPSGAPAIAKALEGIDLSSASGRANALSQLKDLLANIKLLSAADLGGLNLDEFIESILGLIEGLVELEPKIKTAAEKFADGLEAIGLAFEFGAITAGQRLERTKALVAKLFPDLFASIDFSTPESLKASIAKMIEGFGADGEISEAEQAQIDLLRALVVAYDAAADATKAATDAAQDAADAQKEAEERAREEKRKAEEEAAEAALTAEQLRRRRAIARGEALIEANDVEDPIERLKIRIAALKEAFPALTAQLDLFDISTEEGRKALEEFVKLMVESPGLLEPLALSLGLTVEELLEMLLGLEGGLDDATVAVQTLADKLNEAFAELDFDLELNNITDPLERLKLAAATIGSVLPEIAAAIGGFALDTQAGRDAAQAALIALANSTTDPAVRQAILRLLGDIRSVPLPELPTEATPGTPGSAQPITNIAGTPQITAIQADRLLDISASQLTVQRGILDALLGARTFAPNIPASLSGGGSPITFRVEQTNNFGAPSGDDRARAVDVSDDLLRLIDQGLSRLRDRDLLAVGVTSR